MDQSFLQDLLGALNAVRATSITLVVIGFFAIAALLLWMWRGTAIESDDSN